MSAPASDPPAGGDPSKPSNTTEQTAADASSESTGLLAAEGEGEDVKMKDEEKPAEPVDDYSDLPEHVLEVSGDTCSCHFGQAWRVHR